MPVKKDIIYPIFLECCEFVTDNYWSQIFEDLSYGKCPYGCYINKLFLCCNFKGKEFSYKIENKEPNILYEEIYNLFHTKLGLLSECQRKNKLKDMEVQDYMWKNKSWNSIKKKNIKDLIIDNYIISNKKKYNIPDTEINKLKNIIISGIIFKTITPKEINYLNGEIISIKGIEFDYGKIIVDNFIKNYKFQNEKNTEKKEKKRLIDLYKNKLYNMENTDIDQVENEI